MINDPGSTERVHSTSEAAAIVNIATPTVRKYSQALEAKGYEFLRSQEKGRKNARLYRSADIEALRYLTDVRKKTNITVEQAANLVIAKFGKGAIQSIMASDTPAKELDSNGYKELYELITDQNRKINNQSELLAKQSQLILELLERMDKQKEKELPGKTKPNIFLRLLNKL